MDAFLANILYNPLPLIGSVLSVGAVFAFLLFLRGFLSGVMYLFTLNGNDDFLKPARVRVLWAFLLLVFIFSLWEVTRWLGAVVTGSPAPGGLGLAIILFILLFAAYRGAKFLKKNAP